MENNNSLLVLVGLIGIMAMIVLLVIMNRRPVIVEPRHEHWDHYQERQMYAPQQPIYVNPPPQVDVGPRGVRVIP